jgi:hypothetical protein
MLSILKGGRAGEHDEACFRHGVVSVGRRRLKALDRSEIDNCAARSARDHASSRRFGDDEHAVEIDRHHGAPFLKAHLLETAMGLPRGAVDEDIDGAELFRYGSDRGVDQMGIGKFGVHGKLFRPLSRSAEASASAFFRPLR